MDLSLLVEQKDNGKKQRGRPKKSQGIKVVKEKEIILHLPIKISIENDTESPYILNDFSSSSDETTESEEKLPTPKKNISNLSSSTYIKTNLINIKNDQAIIVEKTEIACWWCTYQFDNPPIFLPEKLYDGTYYVRGCFCSLSCAMSYNFQQNDYRVWERYALLRSLYEIQGDLLPAPPREILTKFGGIVSIEKYRGSQEEHKIYHLIFPPMISIVPILETKM